MIELCASILSADFARLAEEVAAAERGGATVIHVDIMDGHFVPNLTIGPPVVKSLRKVTRLPLDCHLMVENADDLVEPLAEAGANWVIVHYEACRHLHRTLQLIAQHGMQPAVVINPATRVDLIAGHPAHGAPRADHEREPRFWRPGVYSVFSGQDPAVARIRQELGLAFRIEVDGGVAHDTVAQVVQAGADLLVAGNAVFGAGHAEQDARALLAAARQAAGPTPEQELQRVR